jgi:hypothetical protein
MIRKEFFNHSHDAFYWVENILEENKDYYLNKEEIYSRIPHDEDGKSYVTISSLETAIRSLARARIINVEYYNGRRYFGYNERKEGDRNGHSSW